MKEENKIYAVVDTNVLVSSLFSAKGSSNPSKVIRCVLNGTITPLYNFEIIEEYRDVLSRDKFHFKPNLINDLLSVFTEFGINTARTNITDEIFTDSDDIVFLK